MIAADLVRAVVDYLKAKNQLGLLYEVAEGLTQAVWTQTDPHLATVTTPLALTASQKLLLKQTLTKRFKQPVKLKTRVDPQLIGGLKITLAGKVIDLSLDRQLNQLGEAVLYD